MAIALHKNYDVPIWIKYVQAERQITYKQNENVSNLAVAIKFTLTLFDTHFVMKIFSYFFTHTFRKKLAHIILFQRLHSIVAYVGFFSSLIRFYLQKKADLLISLILWQCFVRYIVYFDQML